MSALLRTASCALLLALLPVTAGASFADRPEVQAFIDEMRQQHGFAKAALERAFALSKPIPAVIKAILPPANPAIRSWQAYRARFVEKKRIALGLRFWSMHRAALAAERARYGVPEEIVVAIIGIESIYGRHSGRFGTLAALSTLAFDYPPRAPLFRHELEQLLLLSRETRRDPLSFTGSYAGALGLPQFLPSSVRRYAVDGNHDGRIDLAASPADAIASIANFLAAHGWEKGAPVVAPAQVKGDRFQELIEAGIAPRWTPDEMAAYGVDSGDAPQRPAALIDLATPGQDTEYWLGYENFYVLTRYNRSSFYAMAVYDLARALRAARE